MPPRRKLSLKHERLTELTTDDLSHLVAADAQKTLLDCLSLHLYTCASYRHCTTAPSCGCPPTSTCQ